MGNRLSDNISSAYLEAANMMRPKKARRRIVAYVESYDDVLFWRTLLSRYENESRYFEVMLPSRETLRRGKRSVLMSLMEGKVGRDMIACVDADYDYLMQGATETSRLILESPFIFHTYAYSIENLQCYAPSLHDVCVMTTLNDHAVVDLCSIIRKYSHAIFPLLVWSVWHYRNDIYERFSITDFNRAIELGNFALSETEQAIESVRDRVSRKCEALRRHNPRAKRSYLDLKAELAKLGVTRDSAYLYIQGHFLFDKVIMPIMNKVCGILIREREREIRQQAVHETQMRNELSCYSHGVQDISQMLKKNMGYFASAPFGLMRRDIELFLGLRKNDAEANQT